MGKYDITNDCKIQYLMNDSIKYKLEILRLKMGKYDITNDCKIQYLMNDSVSKTLVA